MTVYVSAGFHEDEDDHGAGKKVWRTAKRKVEKFGRDGKPLTGPLRGCYRVSVGDWRCIYEVVGDNYLVLALAHRSEVYDVAERRRDKD